MNRISIILALGLVIMSCSTEKPAPNPEGGPSRHTTESVVPATRLQCVVVATLPHDTMAFTQGLQVVNGVFFESTGQYGSSSIRQVELKTGNVKKKANLRPQFFGEGVTVLDGKAFMLTWLNQQGFIFDATSLEEIGTFRYVGEGWGLTNDGKNLLMSNGTSTITVLDPENARVIRTFDVMLDGSPLKDLNELEFIDGELWANVWRENIIVRIDPTTGRVRSVIDCSNLLPMAERTPSTDVLNGIAFDAATKKIYVTGKNWPHVYEITTAP